MKKVISDASPLIFVAKADLLGEIKRLYKRIYVASQVMSEIERPLDMGLSAPEVPEVIKLQKANVLIIENLTAKEIISAKQLHVKHAIGFGEAESAILFKRGEYDTVIVADARAHRILKELKVNAIDLVDVGYAAAERGIMNPRKFAELLYFKGHYRTQRILDILGRHS